MLLVHALVVSQNILNHGILKKKQNNLKNVHMPIWCILFLVLRNGFDQGGTYGQGISS